MSPTRRHCLWVLAGVAGSAEDRSLSEEWRRIARASDGEVGAAALHLRSGRFARLNGGDRFPLASLCKLPIAMNILALVDEGRLALDQQIEVLPRDIVRSVSDIAARWPAQRRFLLDEMLELMVAHSDGG